MPVLDRPAQGPDGPPGQRLGLLLLFLTCLAGVRWVYGYVAQLQAETTASFYLFDRVFLARWLDHPGGLLLYAGRFLRQFYHHDGLAALVVAATIVAVAALLQAVRRRLAGGAVGPFHTFAPCLALFAVHSASTTTLGLVPVLGAFLGSLRLRPGWPRQAFALAVTPPLYLAVGGFVWLFVAWMVAVQWLPRPRREALAFRLVYPVAALTVPWLAYRWVFLVSPQGAWLAPLHPPATVLEALLLAYLALVPLWPRLTWGARLEAAAASRRGAATQAAALVVLAALLVPLTYDGAARRRAALDRLYRAGRWEEVLAQAARRAPAPPRALGLAAALEQFVVDLALAQRGELLTKLFDHPQPWGTRGLVLDLPDPAERLDLALYVSDLYWALGHVNAAYRQAYNQQAVLGETYGNVRRLAECSLANGNPALAEKYLKMLDRTLFHRDVARHLRQAGPEAAGPEAPRPAAGYDVGLGAFANLMALVEGDAHNRMAFDVLMAWCLLDKVSIPLVADYLPRFAAVGYATLPTACQEALLVWAAASGEPLDLGGFAIDALPQRRFAHLARYAGDHPDAVRAPPPSLGPGFLRYYVYTVTPQDPTPPAVWLRLAAELRARGDRIGAQVYARQALRKDPGGAPARTGEAPADLALTPDPPQVGGTVIGHR